MMDMIHRAKCRNWTGQEFKYIQPKYDGHRVTIVADESSYNAYSRSTKTDHHVKLMNAKWYLDLLLKIPNGSIIDGELWSPGKTATDIPNLLNEDVDALEFTAFAIPYWRFRDHRQECILYITKLAIINDIPFSAPHKSPKLSGFIFKPDKWLDIAKRRGLEGWVLKNAHYDQWYKLKVTHTVDVVVMSADQSWAATNFGDLESLKVGLYVGGKLKEVASVGSGYDVEMRRLYCTDKKRHSLVGRVAEVQYDELAAKGRLKHPRFLRWREDKTPEECTIDQLETN